MALLEEIKDLKGKVSSIDREMEKLEAEWKENYGIPLFFHWKASLAHPNPNPIRRNGGKISEANPESSNGA